MESKIKKYVMTITTAIFMTLTILISFSIIRSNTTHTPPRLFNRSLFMIVSSSMTPNINKGDIILVEYINTDNIEINDVITFNYKIGNNTVPNTHRVIAIDENGTFTTHGDANPEGTNETVLPTSVIGRYSGFKIPFIGGMVSYLVENPFLIFAIIVGLGLVIIVFEIKNFITSYLEVKKEEQNKKL